MIQNQSQILNSLIREIKQGRRQLQNTYLIGSMSKNNRAARAARTLVM